MSSAELRSRTLSSVFANLERSSGECLTSLTSPDNRTDTILISGNTTSQGWTRPQSTKSLWRLGTNSVSNKQRIFSPLPRRELTLSTSLWLSPPPPAPPPAPPQSWQHWWHYNQSFSPGSDSSNLASVACQCGWRPVFLFSNSPVKMKILKTVKKITLGRKISQPMSFFWQQDFLQT